MGNQVHASQVKEDAGWEWDGGKRVVWVLAPKSINGAPSQRLLPEASDSGGRESTIP